MTTTTFAKTADKYNALKTVKVARRARRAYVGLHGLAFERAQLRFKQARQMTETLFADLVVKGEALEDKVELTYTETSAKVRGAIPDVSFAGKSRINELEGEIEALSAKLANFGDGLDGAKAAKTTKTVKAETVVEDKYTPYFADVKGYDAKADMAIVRKIVNYCGIALASRDGKFVACSDETERNTVRDSLLIKKFGLKDDQEELDALVMSVCETMQKDRFKNRVTFYYLLAKSEAKLASF